MGLIAIRQSFDKFMTMGRLCRRNHFLFGSIFTASFDIVVNRIGQQSIFLEYLTDIVQKSVRI